MAERLVVITDVDFDDGPTEKRIHDESLSSFDAQKRGGTGKPIPIVQGHGTITDAVAVGVPGVKNFLCITKEGRCWVASESRRSPCFLWHVVLSQKIPHTEKRRASIRQAVALIPINEPERVDPKARFLVLATKEGMVKRLGLWDCLYVSPINGASIIRLNINRGHEDAIVGASICHAGDLIWLASSSGHVACIRADDIPLQKRRARGVKGMELKEGERVTGILAARPSKTATLTTVFAHGFGKKVDTENFPVHHRDTTGVQVAPDGCELVDLVQTEPGQEVVMLTREGRCIRINEDGIPQTKGRYAVGFKLMDVKEGDRVVRALAVGDPNEMAAWKKDVGEAFEQYKRSEAYSPTAPPVSAATADIPTTTTTTIHGREVTTTTGTGEQSEYTYTGTIDRTGPEKKGFFAWVRDLFR